MGTSTVQSKQDQCINVSFEFRGLETGQDVNKLDGSSHSW